VQNAVWGTENSIFVLEDERRAGDSKVMDVDGVEALVRSREEEGDVRTKMEEDGRRRDS